MQHVLSEPTAGMVVLQVHLQFGCAMCSAQDQRKHWTDVNFQDGQATTVIVIIIKLESSVLTAS